MPAVVRVKRRINEEPLSAFVLNGKKRRLNNAEAEIATEATTAAAGAAAGKDEISTVLKFAGTLNEQDDTATRQFARLTKDAARELVQQKSSARKTTNHTERARQEMRQSLHEQRFHVVNCMRTTLQDDEIVGDSVNQANAATTTAQAKNEITIVDIEKQSIPAADATNATAIATPTQQQQQQPLQEAQQQPSDSDTGYVYDLYLPENEQQANNVDLMDDNYLSVRVFDDFIYEDRYNDEDDDNDSEDSNNENYVGNDYPDDESDGDNNKYYDAYGDDDDEAFGEGTGYENYMRRAVEQFVLAEDDDEDESAEFADNTSSSDDEDILQHRDPYVHTVAADDKAFVDDVDRLQ